MNPFAGRQPPQEEESEEEEEEPVFINTTALAQTQKQMQRHIEAKDRDIS